MVAFIRGLELYTVNDGSAYARALVYTVSDGCANARAGLYEVSLVALMHGLNCIPLYSDDCFLCTVWIEYYVFTWGPRTIMINLSKSIIFHFEETILLQPQSLSQSEPSVTENLELE